MFSAVVGPVPALCGHRPSRGVRAPREIRLPMARSVDSMQPPWPFPRVLLAAFTVIRCMTRLPRVEGCRRSRGAGRPPAMKRVVEGRHGIRQFRIFPRHVPRCALVPTLVPPWLPRVCPAPRPPPRKAKKPKPASSRDSRLARDMHHGFAVSRGENLLVQRNPPSIAGFPHLAGHCGREGHSRMPNSV